jgi:DNA mismatch repair protein MutS2
MHPGTLKALEFDRIVAAMRRLALTPLGDTRLAELRPAGDSRQVAALLGATSEAVKFVAEGGVFALDAPPDLDLALTSLAVEGRALEPQHLLGLARFFGSIDATRNGIRRARGNYPALRALADAATSFDQEVADIRRKIDPSGEVVDDASPQLKGIRERLRKQRSRLRSTLESYLRGKDTARYLQDQIVTDRNGRFVLVVKAENRSSIPGIVHGTSASGASLFLEPLSTVEINNEVVALEQQEAEEVHRILLALSDAFRRRAMELHKTLAVATDLDVLQVKGRFAELCGAIEPRLASDGRLEYRGARHPLLIPAVRELLGPDDEELEGERSAPKSSAGPVPVDILLIPPRRVLIVSGPNTGGKTVALKSAGLLSLMAQAGLHVPAEDGTQITVFRSVFADIGDEQSISASLSTFSWHITNIAAMDRTLGLPALVLLDEVGAGTDPNEGGALGTAVIDHFRHRGALVVATTHYDALKSYAGTTEGVEIAAFGFDPDTFAPTYRLVYGSPGRSLALEMAARLGIPASIIDTARAYRSERETQLSEHLARMEKELNALDHERRLAAREREMLAETTARLQSREQELQRREEAFQQRLRERVDERLREARREIDDVMKELRQKTASLANAPRHVPALSTGETGALRTDARAALDAIEERVRTATPAPAAPATVLEAGEEPRVGDRVALGGFGIEGSVQALHGEFADVDVRGKRMRVPVAGLRVVGRSAAESRPGRVTVQVETAPRSSDLVPSDLNVIGCTADEALTRAEKFLDDAVLQDRRTVRFIHGHGTGVLRRAIGDFLAKHPLVAHYGPAPENEGGSAVTVAELKD